MLSFDQHIHTYYIDGRNEYRVMSAANACLIEFHLNTNLICTQSVLSLVVWLLNLVFDVLRIIIIVMTNIGIAEKTRSHPSPSL